jgi:hypothetical protein
MPRERVRWIVETAAAAAPEEGVVDAEGDPGVGEGGGRLRLM